MLALHNETTYSPLETLEIAAPASNQGLTELQPVETLPTSPHAPQIPVRKAKLKERPRPQVSPNGELRLDCGWELAATPQVDALPQELSLSGVDTSQWYDATVPGTVLTTLVEQGAYPDPYYGLNNLAIPELLNQQNYWYRVPFEVPAFYAGKRVSITFAGVNYAAEVWLNGHYCGEMVGAFIRGTFDVTHALNLEGENVLLVLISPPPHPGLPHEKSLSAGVGPNGGAMCQDGPTFIATEGWDWMPAMRDRCTGIWQEVVLHATGSLALSNPQVVTKLALPATDSAYLTVRAEVSNQTQRVQQGRVRGTIEGISFEQSVILQPNEKAIIEFTPEDFPQLVLDQPRLWWPNGYGKPELYELELAVMDAEGVSDEQLTRFGVREFSYEFAPHLTLLVNGHKVMCKGGNWGMDDAMKRVSRERLEPYIRLHRDAHLTMIRNWTGQSTEEEFYSLCDEYGILVWNDFWMSTGGYNMEPADEKLFLANARDTIVRFRNHPCIAVWCGRNEGVPPQSLNDGLADLVQEHDGTRYYQPNSREIDLMPSGPWDYRNPVDYFTTHAAGFTTELGMPSMPTVEAMRAMMPEADVWPHSDTWAYHDMHRNFNGNSYLEAVNRLYGPTHNIEEFTRNAQMLNYVNHRAMFEAWNSKLFAPCSGVLLWMSHPAWPSTVWQLYSSDYEPNAALFGAQKGCEPVHIQMNLPDGKVAVINNTRRLLPNLKVSAFVYDLDSELVWSKQATHRATPNSSTPLFALKWPGGESAVHFVRLELHDEVGHLISENFYWHSSNETSYLRLNELPIVALEVKAEVERDENTACIKVALHNPTSTVALMSKLSLRDARTGVRILPAFYSDNYLSLLPGATRMVTVECASKHSAPNFQIAIEGFNVASALLEI